MVSRKPDAHHSGPSVKAFLEKAKAGPERGRFWFAYTSI